MALDTRESNLALKCFKEMNFGVNPSKVESTQENKNQIGVIRYQKAPTYGYESLCMNFELDEDVNSKIKIFDSYVEEIPNSEIRRFENGFVCLGWF